MSEQVLSEQVAPPMNFVVDKSMRKVWNVYYLLCLCMPNVVLVRCGNLPKLANAVCANPIPSLPKDTPVIPDLANELGAPLAEQSLLLAQFTGRATCVFGTYRDE